MMTTTTILLVCLAVLLGAVIVFLLWRVRTLNSLRKLQEKEKEELRELNKKVEVAEALEEQLREAKRQAEESSRLKSSFLSNMSHEIRTPLSAIDFGGKYIAVDEHNRGYVLRTELNKAQIIGASTGRVVVDDMAPLLSSNKVGETYDPTTGDWTLGTEESPLQGKHVMVVKDDYAYVGAGLNGLRVYSLSNGTEVKNFDEEKGGPNTTGLCIDGDLLYAATGSGLRVYKMLGEGQLELYAFEVKEYDANGLPNSNEPPTTIDDGTATPGHHFANFVTVLNAEDGNKYIFVAYGQDGVRVYKLIPDATGEEEEVTE